MTWPATARYRLEPAPGGLGLVQDLLNTVAAGTPPHPDLLDGLAEARTWAHEAASEWAAATGLPAPHITLDAKGLRELRTFRETLGKLVARRRQGQGRGEGAGALGPGVAYSGEAALRLGEDGVVRLEPCGTGWGHLVALALAAAYDGQRADTARRLKTCRNPLCRVAFYDRSRNNSGVWHDVKTCGNAANLRAFRARRREQET
ncbi:CGNR zinc finger domain-containing protein [Streptomyces alboniger]|uniref:Zf-CGNR multi-domain protein n=2 Tax=Streptomyces alboniger TaxID=132473 RepID=A0A5J6HDW8_STRAD|nr:CGNR zinc finger domain-containing protein [Streptomyces alboniger]QEV16464.1 zf-CGNR multi-domain protein [Streptomyces alboniger]